MTVAVRLPVSGNSTGSPNISVTFYVLPIAVIVQVLVTSHFGRDITRTTEAVLPTITFKGPTVELVLRPNLSDVIGELIDSRKPSFLAFNQPVRISAACDLSFTVKNSSDRLITIFINLHAILTRLIDIESQVRSVHFEGVIAIHVADAEEYRSNRDPELGNVVFEIKKSQTGFRRDANRSGADLHLSSGISVCPQIVAAGQRTVGNCV
jgi:hypothetical protein